MDNLPKSIANNNFIKIDYLVLASYVLLGTVIYLLYNQNIIKQKTINDSILAFGYITPLLLLAFYYNRLRILKILFCWFIIAIIQIVIYMNFIKNPDFMSAIGGSYLEYLLMLPLLLVMFSIMRSAYWLIYKQELIITFDYKIENVIDNRKLRKADFIFSLIGYSSLIFSPSLITELFNK